MDIGRATTWFRAIIACALSFFHGLDARGDEAPRHWTEPPVTGGAFYLDNDTFTSTDNDYTQGTIQQSGGAWVASSVLIAPLNWFNKRLRVSALQDRNRHGSNVDPAHTVLFGVSAFTPEDLTKNTVIPDDRPYSSISFYTTRIQTIDDRVRKSITSELELGLLGTGIADYVQSKIHGNGRRGTPPAGWHLQISDGGEPTARYSLRWQQRLDHTQGLIAGRTFDAQLITQVDLGYYTAAGVGGAIRVGRLRSPWWGFNPTPIRSYNIFGFAGSGEEPSHQLKLSDAYFWVAGASRAWLYNSLLEGQFAHSDVTIKSSDIKRIVNEFQCGLTVGWETRKGGEWAITFAIASRGPEFESPLIGRHRWGGIYIAQIRPSIERR